MKTDEIKSQLKYQDLQMKDLKEKISFLLERMDAIDTELRLTRNTLIELQSKKK